MKTNTLTEGQTRKYDPLRGSVKGQARKYNAMMRFAKGDEKLAKQMFHIWMDAQPKQLGTPVAQLLSEVLNKHLPNDTRLGNRGFTIKKAKGESADGFVALKND